MSESWGPHDLGGHEGGPVDLSEHDIAHWEWQIDAMVRLALKKGLISDFAELRDGIERLTPADYASMTYYERWAKALAWTLVSRGVVGEAALAAKAQAIRERQEADIAND
jgi:hypothetical protein